MTGTNCDLFTHKSSRSYLNHLVYDVKSSGVARTFDGRANNRNCRPRQKLRNLKKSVLFVRTTRPGQEIYICLTKTRHGIRKKKLFSMPEASVVRHVSYTFYISYLNIFFNYAAIFVSDKRTNNRLRRKITATDVSLNPKFPTRPCSFRRR
jgi:hypothetical protein